MGQDLKLADRTQLGMLETAVRAVQDIQDMKWIGVVEGVKESCKDNTQVNAACTEILARIRR